MLNTMIQVLGLFAALHGSSGAVVDRVETEHVAVLCGDVECVDVPASWVGREGTIYGEQTISVRASLVHDDGADIKL